MTGKSHLLRGFTLIELMITLAIAAILMMVDSPVEVVGGRTLFMFVIPILIASFVIRPYASFFVTAIIGILHITLAYVAGLLYSSPSPRDATLSRMPSSAR